ncbi:MAG: hypothetical protein U0990_12625 [Candidatus Nanopelagicales bacterium]|nr:hypothetical protein [Candidatus Nanopelagicales bacterium]
MIADARIVREYEGVWMRTTDKRTLREGTGLTWHEISLAALEGMDITEQTQNNNPQQMSDTLLSLTPSMVQILVKITDRTYRRIADIVESKMGQLAGNAMARKKDDDYTSLFASFGTGASPGAGQPLSFGHISAAVNRTTSNRNEPSIGNVYTVLRGEQIYDIQNEILAGIGTYTIPSGMTADVFKSGFRGSVSGSNLFEDGNIPIGASGAQDARGATHAREGVVAVQGMSIKTETRRDPGFGGGADEVYMTDEYGFVERSSGNWCYAHLSDATLPTS